MKWKLLSVSGTIGVQFAKIGAGNTLVTLEYRVAGFGYANAERSRRLWTRS